MINSNELVVGSRLHVTKERLNKEINRAHEYVLNLLNNPVAKLHEKHNAFAAYTALHILTQHEHSILSIVNT